MHFILLVSQENLTQEHSTISPVNTWGRLSTNFHLEKSIKTSNCHVWYVFLPEPFNIIGSHKETSTHWCVGNKLHLRELMTCCSCSSILLLSNWVPPFCMLGHVILHFWASGFSSTNKDNDIYIRTTAENNAWYIIGAQLMGGVIIATIIVLLSLIKQCLLCSTSKRVLENTKDCNLL